MSHTQSCRGSRHVYDEVPGAAGLARRKCRRCGTVQIDLISEGSEVDSSTVFAPRRPTLFSLRGEMAEESRQAGFGNKRARR